jgi:hypothetical protein
MKAGRGLLAALVIVSVAATTVVTLQQPAAAAACGSHFWYDGSSLVQQYKNCNGHRYWVAPFFVENSGNVTFFEGSCRPLDDQHFTTWTHTYVVPANYYTGFCAPSPYPSGPYYTSATSCNTWYEPNPAAPGPMNHYYHNCDSPPQRVTSAYWLNSSLYAYETKCADTALGGAGWPTVKWEFSSTRYADYTTVFCGGTAN